MFTQRYNFSPEEVLDYLRKSQSDDPLLTTEEVLAKHELELDEWSIRNLGGKVPEENKFREVVSGETMAARPEFQKLLKKIESPLYRAVKVVEVSRLSRGDLEEIGKLVKLLRFTQTLVITPHKIYDLNDEYDRDNFERELKRGNEYLEYSKKIMQRGKLLACMGGQYIASKPPYGYRKISYRENRRTIKTLEIIPEQAEVVQMAFRLYADGMSMGKIAGKIESLGYKPLISEHWDKGNLAEMLMNHVYLGKVRWMYRKTEISVIDQEIIKSRPRKDLEGMLLFDGLHKPLIDQETFDKVQERRAKNIPIRKSQELANPLAGLLFCKKCGRAYKMRPANERYEAKFECLNMKHCKSGSTPYSDVMEKIYYVLEECIEDFEIKLSQDNSNELLEHEKHIERLERKLKQLEEQEVEQWKAQTHPDESQRMPQHIFRQLNEQLLKDKLDTKETLRDLYENVPEAINYEEKLFSFKEALECLKSDTVEPGIKNEYLKEIIERITIDRDKGFKMTKKIAEEMRIPYRHNEWFTYPFHLDITLKE